MWCTPNVGGPALIGTGDASTSSSRYSSSESFWKATHSTTGSGDGDRGRFLGGSSAALSASRGAATPRQSAANIGESDAASGADAASETHCAAVIAARVFVFAAKAVGAQIDVVVHFGVMVVSNPGARPSLLCRRFPFLREKDKRSTQEATRSGSE